MPAMDTMDLLIEAVEELGYGVDINVLRGKVTVDTGNGKRQFKDVGEALAWVRSKQQALEKFRNS